MSKEYKPKTTAKFEVVDMLLATITFMTAYGATKFIMMIASLSLN